ncbi:TlpA disulfide reductase family protein [Spirosoma pulveris]
MRHTKLLTIIYLCLICLAVQAQVKPLAGFWRGVFAMAGGHTAPFNLELTGKTAYLLNGTERFELKKVMQRGDSLFIPVDVYNTVLAAKVENAKTLTGVFKHLEAPTTGVPFRMEHGKRYRFTEHPVAPVVSMHGKWDILIDEKIKLIGVFEQHGSKLTGTFLSTGGDMRYYDGSVQGDEFALSAFDGSNPQLFIGKISGNELSGSFVNSRQVRSLKGTRNAQAALPDAYGLTKMRDGVPFTFTFPDAFTGKPVSLSDPKYKNKVVIVTTMGSWCHNCMDEAAFLAPWYKANKQRGVEIIGLAFEVKNDPVFAKARLETVKKRYQIGYDMLFAGIADEKHASAVLPALSEMSVYPTTIYVKRNGEVAKVHTGYSGPATGQYYEAFIKEFNVEMDQLLNETTSDNTPGKVK